MCNEDDKVVAFPGIATGAAPGPRHKPALAAFTEAIGHIQQASEFVRRSTVSPEDRKTMLALLAKGAAKVLQANLLYIEKVVIPDGDPP
ncbi:MAG: hypothetical protein ACK4M0_04105 [Phreatobacter sp.]